MYVIFILLAINYLGYKMMGIDKKRAQRGKYRISEGRLWMIALLGGAVGMTIGMKVFRHKTKRWTFKIGFPFLMILQIPILCFIIWWLLKDKGID